MPPCFEKWCQRFDDVFTHKAQKREFRHYVGGLLGESERKNLFQIAENAVGVTYHRLHHFYTQRQFRGTSDSKPWLIVVWLQSSTLLNPASHMEWWFFLMISVHSSTPTEIGYPGWVTDNRVNRDGRIANGWGAGSPGMAATRLARTRGSTFCSWSKTINVIF